jgi:hypothetical protein
MGFLAPYLEAAVSDGNIERQIGEVLAELRQIKRSQEAQWSEIKALRQEHAETKATLNKWRGLGAGATLVGGGLITMGGWVYALWDLLVGASGTDPKV